MENMNIVLDVNETYDEFVFKAVLPFCEHVTQQIITKQQLIQALNKQRPMNPIVEEACAWNDFRTRRYCACCKAKVTKNDKYCRECGQAISMI